MFVSQFNIKKEFPTLITPKRKINIDEFFEFIDGERPALNHLLLTEGALLFRNFPIQSALDFSELIKKLNLGSFVNYIGGDSPRDKVTDGIYTSTEAPPSIHIPLHQELSFIKNFPRHIYFYCEVAPRTRGETIIADARKVLHAFDPTFRSYFERKGLTYISRYFNRSKIMAILNRIQRSHKSWREVFETDNKMDVEKKCQLNDFTWRWLPSDWIEIKQTRPALHNHPITQEPVWFNQAHLYDFNPRLLGRKRYLGAKLFYNNHTRLHDIAFGDGEKIPRDALYHIFDILEQNTVRFPWQKGDVLVLDNILAMHGRATFSGKRKILTALTA